MWEATIVGYDCGAMCLSFLNSVGLTKHVTSQLGYLNKK